MKNFYELKPGEKRKYRKEFNKLVFTKDVNSVRGPLLFMAIMFGILTGLFAGISGEFPKLESWGTFVESITILSILLYVVLDIYLNISFKRWMKIKHKVQY